MREKISDREEEGREGGIFPVREDFSHSPSSFSSLLVEFKGVEMSRRSDGSGDGVGHGAAPCPTLQDHGARSQLQLQTDQTDVCCVEDLCAVR